MRPLTIYFHMFGSTTTLNDLVISIYSKYRVVRKPDSLEAFVFVLFVDSFKKSKIRFHFKKYYQIDINSSRNLLEKIISNITNNNMTS